MEKTHLCDKLYTYNMDEWMKQFERDKKAKRTVVTLRY
jgi:hypothetical protein